MFFYTNLFLEIMFLLMFFKLKLRNISSKCAQWCFLMFQFFYFLLNILIGVKIPFYTMQDQKRVFWKKKTNKTLKDMVN